MKKYSIPEIKISSFSVEDIITESSGTKTAAEEIMTSNLLGVEGVQGVKTMQWAE